MPRTWGDHTLFTDAALNRAAVDIVGIFMGTLRKSFEKTKAKEGWPDDAEPTWEIRWTYTEPYEEQM
jgi:hypothetical protein